MNKLLIHNQKTALLDGLIFDTAEQFVFESGIDTPDVDHYITDELEEGGDLRKKIIKADVVFIKIALSENYLEYLGLRLAYHIRLSKSIDKKARVSIIFVGEESHDFLGRTTELADILFTKGVYLIKDNKEAYEYCVKQFFEGKIHSLTDEDSFLSRIQVAPPANYQTHHSITNEWSILRWADMAKDITDKERDELREHIRTTQTLYFKYLEAKSTAGEARQFFKQEKKKELLIIPMSTGKKEKIYYIDDEQGKGWGKLFEKFIFKEHTDANKFAYCDHFPKGEKRVDLLKRIKEKVAQLIKEGYNVFIIDLRLCDSDFENKEELCGFEVIREIKKINKGVQIVIFTASKKAENVNKAAELGVVRYVLKESPEYVLTRKDSYALFQDFMRQVRDAAEKSFLASFYEQIQKMKQTRLFIGETGDDKSVFRDSIVNKDGVPDKIYALTAGHTSLFLGEALLNAFKILEKLCGFYYINSGSVFDKNNNLIHVIIDTGTQRKAEFEFISNIFFFQTKQIATTIDVAFKKVSFLRTSNTTNRDNESLTQMISVLKFRFNIDHARLKKLIELRYLRSNLAAHDTGSIDTSKRKVELTDVLFLTDLLAELLT